MINNSEIRRLDVAPNLNNEKIYRDHFEFKFSNMNNY